MKKLIVLLFLGGMLFQACKEDKPKKVEKKQVPVPRFEKDSAYAHVVKQLEFGPRVVNSEGHQATKNWLVNKFKSYNIKVIEQNFKATAYTGEVLNGTNIIAQYNPQSRNRILLAAHWDTRHIADSPLSKDRQNEPILGADDGASGVAVLLEVARHLEANPVDIGVDIVLFDAEDYGESKEQYANATEERKGLNSWALGSQHWSKNVHTSGIQYGILLDMVGAKGARFPKEGYSMQFAPEVVNKIWKLAKQMGYSDYFHDAKGGGITDDHFFVNTIAGIKMIDIINLPINSDNKGFGSHWHTHNDNLEVIDKRSMNAVGQVLLAVIYREAGGTL
ncbi:MAG: glutamine cyclotransferase [Saprospiraceae bacterium]|nr:MAG: glutamine cyclotransferase [Saprospiraceae bacterium]